MSKAAPVGNATARRVKATDVENHAVRVHTGMLVFASDSGSVFAVCDNLFARLTDESASLFLCDARLDL